MKGLSIKLVAIAFLAITMWSCNQPKAGEENTAKENKEVAAPEVSEEVVKEVEEVPVAVSDNVSIVFLNTDTLWNNYNWVRDAMDKLNRTEASMRRQYEAKAKKFQADYEEYMKKGQAGLLSLKEQQEGQKRLEQQQLEIQQMDKTLSERLIRKKQQLNQQINDTIYAFIERYRVEKGYSMIVAGVVAGDPALDVTKDVLERLNAKYEFESKH